MNRRNSKSEKIDIFAVANKAGVSPATVSRAFNHPDLVKPETRNRIEDAVRGLGYIRNRAAQTIHGKRSGTIGLVVPVVANVIFSELIQAFSEVAEETGFTILIATHGFDLKKEEVVLRKLLEHRVDGIALIGLDHLDATYVLVEQQKIPAIAMWNFDDKSRLSCVGVDNHEAGYLAAKHLSDLGHKKIALAMPPTEENDRARARAKGARIALAEAGLEAKEGWTVEALYEVAHAKQACLELLSGDDRPTALVCGNDVIAKSALFAAQRLKLSVPEDLSIVGIGDFSGSADLEPPMTTVRIPATRIGRQAMHHLAISIAESNVTDIMRSKLDVNLMVRGSTAIPPQNS
ncbi:LacI family DNA-binding transcriptional regulator [Rhodobacteraceae bacterium RKSG542]|uniref:LacI family DNA-binding transcriptional regulator n=1 Tax=Pseudovibrio flavus TaxID=2529854 RepID=UPI0012BD0A61|nr:LacI family DNA-binding transcriptional regulator [Pseudovibrio flavus]MTI18090.1 LacI family DNA-binding transcriptional regulator [Pseudovibrio flavus]